MNRDPVHATMERLVRSLRSEGIDYAIIGGMAMAGLGLVRVTQDVDVLLTPAGLRKFTEHAHRLGYTPAFSGARKTFMDVETRVRVEVLATGEYPGDGKPKPVAFPDPAQASTDIEGVRIITLEKLIELKLASGTSAPHRLRDLADVQDLVLVLHLPSGFADRLDPSVRSAFLDLWHASREAPPSG
ncbi:MAG: nucleotidyltransferase family protein [Acidobacteria bacterium]|nr:nucleotidyltransferase family protein [Acidobacteriota bacterium]